MVVASVLASAAQQPTPTVGTPATPSFEVASIRPNTGGLMAQSSRIGKGSVTIINNRVRALIVTAYGVRPERIVGAPSWINQERFDIAARAPADTPDSELRPMLRTLLTERFRLGVRTEIREGPVYALVIARAGGALGPNLKRSTECDASGISSGIHGSALPPGKRPCTVITGSDGREAYITGGARSVEELVRALQGLAERPVVDRTSLTGTYDFDLRFSAAPLAVPPTAAPEYPSIFTAVHEQLGLRLEPSRAPLEFLVVENIERPLPN
jgi:uncharacterized protein (TIGR03435 family)